MTPTVPSARTQRKAQVVQWIAYLLVSIALGFCWFPAAVALSVNPGGPNEIVRTAVWVATTGLLLGGLLRGSAARAGRTPSLWLAALFPLLGALGRSFAYIATGSRFDFADNVLYDFFISTLYGYTCLGIFAIPMATAHVAVLRWTHMRLEAWAPRADWRAANRAAYAVGCVIAVTGVEGMRYVRNEIETGVRFARRYGFEVPRDTVFVGRSSFPTSGIDAYWLRSDRNLPWPPSKVAKPQPLTHAEEDIDVAERARKDANADPRGYDVEVRSVKWVHGERLVQANLVRVGSVDYVEVIPW